MELSVAISNTGGEAGSYTATLYVNDSREDSRTVSIAPGATETVLFSVTESEPGTYQVSLEGKEGQFTVMAPGTSSLSGLAMVGIIAIAIGAMPLILPIVLLFATWE